METGLLLLLRDGPVRVTFEPHLPTQHYDDFLVLVQGLGTGLRPPT